MRGFDVGGSHKSQQTEYESFGIRGQHRVLADGVDTTEGTGGTGFYFDYYSIEEFTTTAAGADVEMTSPGSLLMMTMKSGGNDFSGMFHADYEPEAFVGENIDDALAERGYTGNPNLLFFETHADLGGPIVRDRAWFYGFYNHFRIDKAVSGVDRAVATDLGRLRRFRRQGDGQGERPGPADRLHAAGTEAEAEAGPVDRRGSRLGARPGQLELGLQGRVAARMVRPDVHDRGGQALRLRVADGAAGRPCAAPAAPRQRHRPPARRGVVSRRQTARRRSPLRGGSRRPR